MQMFGAGFFWTSDQGESHRVPGTLDWDAKLSPRHLLLETFGHVESEAEFKIGMNQTDPVIPIIHGVIHTVPITLINSRPVWMTYQRNFMQVRYRPDFIIRGRHSTDEPTDYPSKIDLRVSGLPSFMNWRGFPRGHGLSHHELIQGIDNYEPPKIFEWKVPNFDILLTGEIETRKSGDTSTLTEYGYFRIGAKSGLPVATWYEEIVIPLLDLLRFASSDSLELEGISANFPLNMTEGATGWYRGPIQIFTNRIEAEPIVETTETESDWLFKAEDLTESSVASFLERSRRDTSIHRRLEQIIKSPLDHNEKLLQLTRLLEATHRNENPIEKASLTIFNQRVSDITDHVCLLSSNDGKLVKRMLKYGYEPTLRERLSSLVKPWLQNFQLEFDTAKQFNTLLSDIVNHRNYLAHGLPADKDPLFGRKLTIANITLEMLTRLIVLQRSGWAEEASWEAVSRTERYDYLRQLIAWELKYPTH